AMEDTYGVNMLAVKDQQPHTFSLRAMIGEFISFQEELYTKEYAHLLAKARDRQEIVAGLLRATDVIDLIIEVLRGSNSIQQAKKCLIQGEVAEINFKSVNSKIQATRFDFTERQAEAILSMPLSRLIGLEILKLKEEESTLSGKIDEYEAVLGDKKKLHKVIKKRLLEYKKIFDYKRKTTIDNLQNAEYVEEFKVEDIVVLIDRFGYTKTMDQASFLRVSEDSKREYPHILYMQNIDRLCVFTAQGNMHQVKAEKIPKCKIKDKGTLIHTLCKLDKEDIIFYTSFEALFESQLLFTTAHGYIKLVSGAEFETNRSLIAATKLEDGDLVAGIQALSATERLSGAMKVILITERQLSLGFSLEEVSELKKTSRGVKAILLDANDKIIFATCLPGDTEVFEYQGALRSAKKIKNRKRGAKGQKAQF
ncbi:MAG: gyrase subunit, partial [Clostridiales bacterium]|nr:gyrase subunit [Clostridiales bacterium]